MGENERFIINKSLGRSKDFYAGKKTKNIMTQTKTTVVSPDKIRTGSFLAFN